MLVQDKNSKLANNHVALKEGPKPLPIGYIVSSVNSTSTDDMDYNSVCDLLREVKAHGGSVTFLEPSDFYRRKQKQIAAENSVAAIEMAPIASPTPVSDMSVADQQNHMTVL
jgi:hypothetical protein